MLLAADGKNAAEIARAINIAPNTVKTHMQNAFDKLGIKGPGATKRLILRREELLHG